MFNKHSLEINEVQTILQKFEEVRAFMKCQQCSKEDKILGRLKNCGHYFCKNCLKNFDQNCPKCKIFIEEKNIDWNNIFIQSRDTLSNLHNCLLQALKNTEFKANTNNCFKYENKTYQLNFIEEAKVNAKGESALHVACRKKKLEEVEKLLKNNADINAPDFAGWVPLHEAIESGSEEIVELLIKNGALIDLPGEDYRTPLHKAVLVQNISIIKLLLQYGANKESIDYFGKKPLDCIKNYKELESLFNEQVQTVNVITHLFCSKKMVAFCYYVEPHYINKLKQSKIKIEEVYIPTKVTHFIIRKTHKLSIKILTAMLEGCTIVPQEYIDDYLRNQLFISIPEYTFINLPSLNHSIQKAMLNDLLRLPKLFDGIKFYLTGHFTTVLIHDLKICKDDLITLINAGGGKVLHRAPTPSTCEEKIYFPFHARNTNATCCNYIIYEEKNPPMLMYHMKELKHKSSKWLFECAMNFSILD